MKRVLVLRPRHPLQGQRLVMLGQMRRHGRVELLLVLPDGSKRLIPAEWTDQATNPVEPGPATLGSRADLLAGVGLVAELLTRTRGAGVQAASHPPGKEEHHAACTDEFATRPDPGATTESSARSAAPIADRRRDRRTRPADRSRGDHDPRGGLR